MKKLLAFFVCMAGLGAYACSGGERPITMEQLPAAARQFVTEHFEGVKVAHVMEDAEAMTKTYEVWFVSGDKIEFAKDGTWTDVDCKYSSVPMKAIPAQIAEYLTKTYPDAAVWKIERDRRGYEVKLANGMELKFDKQYKLLKIED